MVSFRTKWFFGHIGENMDIFHWADGQQENVGNINFEDSNTLKFWWKLAVEILGKTGLLHYCWKQESIRSCAILEININKKTQYKIDFLPPNAWEREGHLPRKTNI
jgi:hypothetical protein